MTNFYRQILLTTFLFFTAITAQSNPAYTGKVVAVSDGDTIKILVDKQQLKIRLAEIGVPEKAQSYGAKAKQALSGLCMVKRLL